MKIQVPCLCGTPDDCVCAEEYKFEYPNDNIEIVPFDEGDFWEDAIAASEAGVIDH